MQILTPNIYYAADAWAAQHPDDDRAPCCDGAVYDVTRCTCWRPVYAQQQAPPDLPSCADELLVQPRMCGDCAYRKGSPERSDPYTEEKLLALADDDEVFWCHQGMRRPERWEHPDGRTVPGHHDDWHPARVGRFLFQADGTVALLCAGWAHRAVRARGAGARGPGAPS